MILWVSPEEGVARAAEDRLRGVFWYQGRGHASRLGTHFRMVPLNVVPVSGSDVLHGMHLKLGHRAVSHREYKRPWEK